MTVNMQYDHEGFSIYLSVYVRVYTHKRIYIQRYLHIFVRIQRTDGQLDGDISTVCLSAC